MMSLTSCFKTFVSELDRGRKELNLGNPLSPFYPR
jgi:hypothetical protein